jgi:hypothetical protein
MVWIGQGNGHRQHLTETGVSIGSADKILWDVDLQSADGPGSGEILDLH